MLASTGSSCQTKWPVAAKLFEIDGHASEKSTSLSVSSDLLRLVAHSDACRCRCAFRRRRRPARVAPASGCAPALRSAPDQLDCPSGSRSTAMVGRSSETSAISTRPISSGKNRSRAVSRSAVSAGSRWRRRASTSAKLTLPFGKQRNGGRAAQHGSRPVTARKSRRAPHADRIARYQRSRAAVARRRAPSPRQGRLQGV